MGFYSKIYFILLTTCFLASCAGGGGGGSSSINYTPEYNNQPGLDMIGVQTATDAGIYGDGVNIAIVDTGYDYIHGELGATDVVGISYDSNSVYYVDGNGHGSHVAGIIRAKRDGSGMRGVAPSANLKIYKIFDQNGTYALSSAEHVSMINSITTNADFSNNSWGSTTTQIDDINSTWITNNFSSEAARYQNSVSNDTVHVWATHNQGDTQPSYQAGLPAVVNNIEDGWIAVMALDNNKQETDYSNRCGNAADWCVAAPGGGDSQSTEGIYSVKSGGGYTRLSGTSMAAPHVTGLLALVKERFTSSSLTNKQVRTRLLNGATYSGLTDFNGNSASSMSTSTKEAIFGQGLVTYSASVAQIGSLTYPTSSNFYDENNQNVSQNKIALPSNLYNNISNQISNLDVMAFDSFDGADFTVKGNKIFDTDKKKRVKKFGYSNEENKTSSAVLNYFNRNINYTVSDSFDITQQKNWDTKNNFLNYFSDPSGSYSNLEYLPHNSSLSYFVQYPNIENRFNSYSAGFNYNKNFYDKKLNILLNYIDHKNLITDYSFIKKNNSLSDVKMYDFGFIYKYNNNTELFFRQKREYLTAENSSNYNFSIDTGHVQSDIYGIEYKKNNMLLSTGFYRPNHFKDSELTFLTPGGKNLNGDILWKEQTLYVDNNLSYSPYISIKNKLPSILPQLKDNYLTLNLRQSPYDNSLIDSGEILFTINF